MNTGLNLETLLDLKQDKDIQDVLVDRFPPIHSIPYRFNFGTFAWKIPDLGVRYIKKSNAVYIRDDWFEPPTAITRAYLDLKFPKRLRASGAQARELNNWISAPLMTKPGVYKDMVYVDVKSAYWSIVRRYGWNVDYFPNRWLLHGADCGDFPLPDNKIARNCLLSFCLPTTARIWNGQKFETKSSRNNHLNLGLWRLTQDILHSIAAFCAVCGGVYTHTDGHCIPIRNEEIVGQYIRRFGIDYSVKGRGDCILTGFASYIIGEKRTKHFHTSFDTSYTNLRQYDNSYINIIRDVRGVPHRRSVYLK